MAKDLFRKQSLEKLSSPEQLDLPTRAVTPKGWLSLAAFCAFLTTVIAWSILGTIPTNVNGVGVLVSPVPSSVVVAETGGLLTEFAVSVGQEVREGDVLARLHLPDLEEQLRQTRKELIELKEQHTVETESGRKSLDVESQAIERTIAALRQALDLAAKRQRVFEELVRKQQSLLSQSLITEQQLIGSMQALDQITKEIGSTHTQIKEQEARVQKARELSEANYLSRQLRLNNQQRILDQLAEKLQRSTRVVSPRAGRVIALRAAPQSVVAPGTPLLQLAVPDHLQQHLETLAYVNVAQGKQIQVGMPAEVSPTTVKREQFGYLIGQISYVSALPVDASTLLARLGNREGVERILHHVGVPYEVRIALEADPDTPSGYRWSSGKGPAFQLETGTPCLMEVTIKKQPPVTLVLPFLKKELGVD